MTCGQLARTCVAAHAAGERHNPQLGNAPAGGLGQPTGAEHPLTHAHTCACTESGANMLCMCADTCVHTAAALVCILMLLKGFSLSPPLPSP